VGITAGSREVLRKRRPVKIDIHIIIIIVQRPYNRNTAHVECKNKGDTSKNRGDFKVMQKIREQHTRKT